MIFAIFVIFGTYVTVMIVSYNNGIDKNCFRACIQSKYGNDILNFSKNRYITLNVCYYILLPIKYLFLLFSNVGSVTPLYLRVMIAWFFVKVQATP